LYKNKLYIPFFILVTIPFSSHLYTNYMDELNSNLIIILSSFYSFTLISAFILKKYNYLNSRLKTITPTLIHFILISPNLYERDSSFADNFTELGFWLYFSTYLILIFYLPFVQLFIFLHLVLRKNNLTLST